MNSVFIALGSNLKRPLQQLITAAKSINAHKNCDLIAFSNIYISPPQGTIEQPDYLNAVIKINTNLDPIALLDFLQSIESSQQRTRELKWGPRTIDLDIIMFADQTIVSERLTVPHIQLPNRAFVVIPLLDINPELTLPNGKAVAILKDNLTSSQLSLMISSIEFARACRHSYDSLQ